MRRRERRFQPFFQRVEIRPDGAADHGPPGTAFSVDKQVGEYFEGLREVDIVALFAAQFAVDQRVPGRGAEDIVRCVGS